MIRLAVLALVCVTAACKSKQRPHDDALKQQILSGDHAPLKVPAPVIVAKSLATDPVSRKLVFVSPLTMLERRLDHFQIKNKIVIDGPGAIGNRTYEHQLRAEGRNAFSIKHSATGAEQVEWIAAENQAFVKHGKGPWRKKPYTLQHAETLKNELTFSLADLYTLFGEQMSMTLGGETSENGRPAFRYSVDASDKAPAKTSQDVPSLLLKNDVEPVSLQGECVIDRDTGVLLSADLKATLALLPLPPPAKSQVDDAPPPPPQSKTTVKVRFQWSIDSLADGDKKKLMPELPTDAVEDKGFDRPPADALGFWGPVQPVKDDKDKDKEEDD